jgi:hypothetical protein
MESNFIAHVLAKECDAGGTRLLRTLWDTSTTGSMIVTILQGHS